MKLTDKFCLYKYAEKKPFFLMGLEISGNKTYWKIPSTAPIKREDNRVAIENPDIKHLPETDSKFIVAESDVKIKYSGKRKIIFTLDSSELDVDEIVLLVPSWGLRTEKKIWVLIPV